MRQEYYPGFEGGKRNSPESIFAIFMPKFLAHLDTQDSLPQEDVTASGVDVVVAWVTGVDHESVHELHGLGTLTTELAGNYNLATLGSALHDETQHTIAGPE